MVAKTFSQQIRGVPLKAVEYTWNGAINILQAVVTGETGPVGELLGWLRTSNIATASEFSVENEIALYNKYGDNTQMVDGQKGETGVEKFEAVLTARATSKLLAEKLGSTDKVAADAAAASLASALEYSAELKHLQDEMEAFKEYIAASDANTPGVDKYHPSALVVTIKKKQEDVKNLLEKQRNAEKQRIEKLFQNDPDPNFTSNVKKSMGLPATAADSEIMQVKKSMLDAVDESHNKALEPYDKDMAEITKNMEAAAQKARDLYLFALLVYEHSSHSQRREILKLCKREPQPLTIGLGKGSHKKGDELRGIDLRKIPRIKTISGATRVFSPPGTYSLEMPWVFMPYHVLGDKKIVADMMLLAAEIKANGKEEITFHINHADENSDKWRMHLAVDAYLAAIEAGFPKDKIKIIVNGEVQDVNKLMGKASLKQQHALQNAEKKSTAREKLSQKMTTPALHSMKEKIRAGRQAISDEKAALAAAPPVPVPGSSPT